MKTVKIDIPQKQAQSYDIIIKGGLIKDAQNYIKKATDAKKFLIVTNKTILEKCGALELKNSTTVTIGDGEEYKNIYTLKKILDAAVEAKLERKDCIIAYGGGVVGDIAGFAASSYMRGIDFIQIPTTLLAQVDSSVGGKVAINHEHGKNLIGAFYQPKLVLADIDLLKTLDDRQFKTGLAEVLKYALIEKSCAHPLNFRLFDFLEKNINAIYEKKAETLSQLVEICCSLKAAVVQKDETEKGLRAILNLGHTFAHAIENLTHYTVYTHGEAVAWGMQMALNLSLSRRCIEREYYDRAMQLIKDYGITPEKTIFDKDDFINEMYLDKKVESSKIRFVLPDGAYTVGIYSDIDPLTIKQSAL